MQIEWRTWCVCVRVWSIKAINEHSVLIIRRECCGDRAHTRFPQLLFVRVFCSDIGFEYIYNFSTVAFIQLPPSTSTIHNDKTSSTKFTIVSNLSYTLNSKYSFIRTLNPTIRSNPKVISKKTNSSNLNFQVKT